MSSMRRTVVKMPSLNLNRPLSYAITEGVAVGLVVPMAISSTCPFSCGRSGPGKSASWSVTWPVSFSRMSLSSVRVSSIPGGSGSTRSTQS